MRNDRPFLRWFVTPAALAAAGTVAMLAAILQYALRAHVPGSLEPGGFTLANFATLLRPLYAGVFLDTVLICLMTAAFSLLAAYPLAYALVRARRRWVRSLVLIASVTPLFLGEVVRTYAWLVVLGGNGFVNGTLRALGLIERPLPLMFTRTGVLLALVHVTLPVVVIMLAAGLAHVDRTLERAAQALGAGPVRTFLTVTLPLSLPGVVAGLTTAFAWTFSAFATPQIIGGGKVNLVSNLVYSLGLASFNFPFAAALSAAGLALTALALALLGGALRPLARLGRAAP
ncbi:ABC transporter permease [Roseomonas sp. NAR14]|uniref:ABC transporter permease n=1 Tax=Roseomonas acroporae TaxID=2937791 RepID=A0A9X1Y6E8_9PROT|nr:ABC transporter permease [Roseomonas acroporae]MCK8784383.1 ABC transporter permease [Roseomonas acroporae]